MPTMSTDADLARFWVSWIVAVPQDWGECLLLLPISRSGQTGPLWVATELPHTPVDLPPDLLDDVIDQFCAPPALPGTSLAALYLRAGDQRPQGRDATWAAWLAAALARAARSERAPWPGHLAARGGGLLSPRAR